MYTPVRKQTRMLFTVRAWTRADKLLKVYVGPSAFQEFYNISEQTVEAKLGSDGWHSLTSSQVDQFIQGLQEVFEIIEKNSN